MNFKKRLTTQSVGFQMAPMVDILFLLLVFFMVSSIYAQWERKLDITVPTADTGVRAARKQGEIIINLDEKGDIYINSVQMSAERLRGLLTHVADSFKGHPVIIRADAKTHHEKVILILDICRDVDIWNVAFATIPNKPAE